MSEITQTSGFYGVDNIIPNSDVHAPLGFMAHSDQKPATLSDAQACTPQLAMEIEQLLKYVKDDPRIQGLTVCDSMPKEALIAIKNGVEAIKTEKEAREIQQAGGQLIGGLLSGLSFFQLGKADNIPETHLGNINHNVPKELMAQRDTGITGGIRSLFS